MKKIFYSISALMIIASFFAIAKPKMVFECGTMYDWGTIKKKDSPLKADIKLYNNGDDTLDIKRVKPMCGCTTAPLSKKILSPGDSAVLKVTLNIEHYEGVVLKRINFTTNETNPESYLEIKANVYQPIKLFPSRYLNFSRMFLNTEAVSKIVINNISGHNIKVTNLVIKPEELKVNIKTGDVILKDSDYVVEAKVIPTTLGQFNCRLEISLDDPDEPNIIISGWGKVDPESEKNVDYSKDTDTSDNKAIDDKDKKPGSPVLIMPTNEPMKIKPVENSKMEILPQLPVEPLVPDKRSEIQSPTNVIPLKAEPVEMHETGKPVQMLPPLEEPKKEKKK